MPSTKDKGMSTAAREQKPILSRRRLTGKFPHIKHHLAPKARCILSEEVRDQMVARMTLI